MTTYGLTFGNGTENICQTGYIYPTVTAAKLAAKRMLPDQLPTSLVDAFPGAPWNTQDGYVTGLTEAWIEGDDYTTPDYYQILEQTKDTLS